MWGQETTLTTGGAEGTRIGGTALSHSRSPNGVPGSLLRRADLTCARGAWIEMVELAVTAFVTLFVIFDPLGNIPIFLAVTPRASVAERWRIALKANVIAGVFLLLFAFAGEQFLRALNITVPAFRIAGGILLLLLAVEMVFARHSGLRTTTIVEEKEAVQRHDVAVFPLAVPLIAGPGAMTSMILLMGNAAGRPAEQALVVLVLALVLVVNFLVLAGGSRIIAGMGITGVNVLTRIAGIILTGLAVQFIIDGIDAVIV